MHAVLGMLAEVKEKELAKKSAAAKIAAEKEKSDKIREGCEKSNALRKRSLPDSTLPLAKKRHPPDGVFCRIFHTMDRFFIPENPTG